jgi:hypothetical protein
MMKTLNTQKTLRVLPSILSEKFLGIKTIPNTQKTKTKKTNSMALSPREKYTD